MSEPVYEMLWDCPACGTEKLLGVTHRFCPNCGSPQAADARYFPSEEDKVAVNDHVFHGADWVCSACESANSNAAEFCFRCGAPKDGSKAAKLKEDRPEPAPEPEPEEKKGKGGLIAGVGGCAVLGIGAALLVIIVVVVLSLFSSSGGATVTGHTWERQIDVEELQHASEDGWCDEMPAGAQEQRRTQKDRTTREVPDGEDCATRNVDNGDGTFHQVEECTPRTRTEPVQDAWCTYQVDKWQVARTETASGQSLAPAPSWPQVRLQRSGCRVVGCQREGERRETYTVAFEDDKGKRHTCDVPQARWSAFTEGSTHDAKYGVTGGLKCGSLQP